MQPFSGTVYRGVQADLTSRYTNGKTFTWWALTSCTQSVKALEDPVLMGQSGVRTLFAIKTSAGFDLQAYSFFTAEKEVVLPPGLSFKVTSTANLGSGLTMIHIEQIESPYCII